MNAPRSTHWITLGVTAVVALAACSDEVIDEATARDLMQELTTSIDDAIIDNQFDAHGISIPCAQSGTQNISGHATMSSTPMAVDVFLRVAYRGCRAHSNRTLDGTIYFNQSLDAAADPMRISATYRGHLEISGSVVADCPIDIAVVMDSRGRSVGMSGNFCQRDASTMSMTVTPLWNRQAVR